jgi:hypothetical protein
MNSHKDPRPQRTPHSADGPTRRLVVVLSLFDPAKELTQGLLVGAPPNLSRLPANPSRKLFEELQRERQTRLGVHFFQSGFSRRAAPWRSHFLFSRRIALD